MPAKKKSRRLRLVLIGFVVLLVAGMGYGSYWSVATVRASFPQTTGSLRLPGLSASVEVKRDANGIPQIYAATAEDLFRAQGYVQAQDRFWEMDVRRHLTAGRLSEMFGSTQVQTDAFLRTMGWRRVAQQEYDHELSATTKRYLRAYSAGVNAYLAHHSGAALSVEYAALKLTSDYKPARWTPVDSVSWLKAMAWDLRGNVKDEIDRSLMMSRLTAAQIAQLYPGYPYRRNDTIVSGGTVDQATGVYQPDAADGGSSGAAAAALTSSSASVSSASSSASASSAGLSAPVGASVTTASANTASRMSALSDTLDSLPALLGPSGDGIGSNSWVVSGKLTTTGKPLLANDPHLAPQIPSIWYQMGLHCRTVSPACPYDVSGYTFSGLPGVVIGHNQDIAWGMTNLGADVSDLYLEKVTGEDTYLYDGRNRKFVTRREVIKVAGGPNRVITVRGTNNGPVISDRDTELQKVGETAPVGSLAPDRGAGYAVSLKWTALTPSRTMDAVFEIDRAADWNQFRSAARDFAVPSQNLVYADTSGNIGYQAPGDIPIRARNDDGSYPAPGWDPAYDWKGYIPFSALPYEYNPARGYIVTANQAVIDESAYPYLLTKDWDYGTRSQRITDLIRSKTRDGGLISMDDMQEIQNDDSSQIAKLLVPYLLRINISDDKNAYVRDAQRLLANWDYQQDADSPGAAYFNAVWRNILKLAFGNKLPKELRPLGQCLTVPATDQSVPVEDLDGQAKLVRECGERAPDQAQPDGGDRWFEVVRGLLNQPHSPWWYDSPTAFFDNHSDKPRTDRDQLLAEAMRDARQELTAKLGKDISTWSWGRLHQLDLTNQTLGTDGPSAVKWLLNRGPWQLAGGEAAVDATGWNAAGGYDVVWVPSMRMVVNLADFDKSRWINLTGASGHAYDAHYADQTELWARGRLLPWAYSTAKVAQRTRDTLTLTP